MMIKKGGARLLMLLLLVHLEKNYSFPQNHPGMTSVFPPAQNEMLRRPALSQKDLGVERKSGAIERDAWQR